MSRRAQAPERALAALGTALLAAAAALALAPEASCWLRDKGAEARFAESSARLAALDDAAAALALAREANRALAGGGPGAALIGEAAAALDDGTGAVCWIEAPAIALVAPVYGDCSEDHLADGAGLAPGTSLPVGGEPCDAVVLGHSGMPAARVFDRLDGLSEGDEVVVWALGERLSYRVASSALVSPEEAERLGRSPSGDAVTLVTCRPAGVNSHRLAVRCERGGAADVPAAGAPWPGWLPPAAAGALLAPAAALLRARGRERWFLVRATGAHPLSEADIAGMGREAGPMRLDLRRGGRARLRIFGEDARGTWSRASDDLGTAYRMELGWERFGPYRLLAGPFCARGEGGEIAIWANEGASCLRFARKRPSRAAGRGPS